MFMLICRKRAGTIGLLAVLISGLGVAEARAAFGIVITETILMPVEDPLAQYDFKLSLAPSNQLIQGDNITFLNIPDFSGQANYVFTSGGVDYSPLFSIRVGEGSSAGSTSIELLFTSAVARLVNASTTDNLSIGDLYVTTTDNYPPPSNSPLYNPIAVTTQTHLFPSGALNLGSGFAPTPTLSTVPEPASGVLLGIGCGALGLVLRGSRRKVHAA